MSITRINDFRAAPGREQALREFLQSVIALIEGSAGCLEVVLLADQESADHLVIVEKWESVAAHQEAAKRIPPDKIAEVGKLLAGPPSGRTYSPA